MADAEGYGIDLEQSQHFTNNTWRHWAFCKESGTTTFYINGANKKILGNNASAVNWNTQRSYHRLSTKTWFRYYGHCDFADTTEIRISNNEI